MKTKLVPLPSLRWTVVTSESGKAAPAFRAAIAGSFHLVGTIEVSGEGALQARGGDHRSRSRGMIGRDDRGTHRFGWGEDGRRSEACR